MTAFGSGDGADNGVFGVFGESFDGSGELAIEIEDAGERHFGGDDVIGREHHIAGFRAGQLDALGEQIAGFGFPFMQVVCGDRITGGVGFGKSGSAGPFGPVGLAGTEPCGDVLGIGFGDFEEPAGGFEGLLHGAIDAAKPHAGFAAFGRLGVEREDLLADVAEQSGFEIAVCAGSLVPGSNGGRHGDFSGVESRVGVGFLIVDHGVSGEHDGIERVALSQEHEAEQVAGLSDGFGITVTFAEGECQFEQSANFGEVIIEGGLLCGAFGVISGAIDFVGELLDLSDHAASAFEGGGEIAGFAVFFTERGLEAASHGEGWFAEGAGIFGHLFGVIESELLEVFLFLFGEFAGGSKLLFGDRLFPENPKP